MKKQNRLKILFLIIMGLMFIFSIFEFIEWLNEPEFKITKEECSKYGVNNETAIAKYEVLSSRESELRTDFNRENCDVLEKYGMLNKEEICVWLDTELKEINKQMSIPLKNWGYYEDICEQVEVDEIVLNKILFFEEINWSWDKSEFIYIEYKSCDKINDFKYECKLFSDTSENFSVIVEAKNIDTSLSKTISKEDLTIDLLEKNCEVKQFDRELSEDELKDVRGIYQCQEYEVRILK